MKRMMAMAIVAMAAVAALGAFSGSLIVQPSWTHTGASDLSTASETFDTLLNWTFTDGDAADKMDALYVERRSLAASGSEDLDLAGGITNTFGEVLTLTKVRMLIVRPNSTNLNTISVGGAAANGFAAWSGATNHTVTVRAGGTLMLLAPDATGYAVTAGTGDLLTIQNDGTNGVSYDIYIGGSE